MTNFQELIHGDDSDDCVLYLLASSNLLVVEDCSTLMCIVEVLNELHLQLRKLMVVRVTNETRSLQSVLTFLLKLCEASKNSHYILFEIFLNPLNSQDTTPVSKLHLCCDAKRNVWWPVSYSIHISVIRIFVLLCEIG